MEHIKGKPKGPLSAYNQFFKYERKRILEGFNKEQEKEMKNEGDVEKKDEGDKTGNEVEKKDETEAEDSVKKEDAEEKEQPKSGDPAESEEESKKIEQKGSIPEEKLNVKKKPHGKIDFDNLAKTIGQRWAKLPAKELAVYKELANDDMKRYTREMEVFLTKKQESDEMNAYNRAAAEYRLLHPPEVVQEVSQKKKRDTMDQSTKTGTGTDMESSKKLKPAPQSKAEIDAVAAYEEEKEISIGEFLLEDDELCCVPREVWEGGKHDFAVELYEKAEKANGQKHVPIFDRDVFKIMWIVECLRRQKDKYIKLSAPTLLKRPTDAIPSIVSNIKLIGTFPTEDWMEDPAWVAMGFPDSIGFYKVVDFDITVADGSIMKLNAIVNDGNADCNTGYWGGIFMRDSSKKVATIYSDGDMCTKIVQVSSNLASSFVPFAETDLDFTFDDEVGEYFSEGLSPGFCTTQFEMIMGMGMHRFMNNELWHEEDLRY